MNEEDVRELWIEKGARADAIWREAAAIEKDHALKKKNTRLEHQKVESIRLIERWRLGAAGLATGRCGCVATGVATASWRRCRRHVEIVDNFALVLIQE